MTPSAFHDNCKDEGVQWHKLGLFTHELSLHGLQWACHVGALAGAVTMQRFRWVWLVVARASAAGLRTNATDSRAH